VPYFNKKIFFLLFLLLSFLSISCISTLPEYVHKRPLKNYWAESNVVVFSFDSPVNAPYAGYAAAKILYQELIKSNIFKQVVFEYVFDDLTLEDKIRKSLSKGCELIITGKINYYFEGSLLEESRVDEEIQITNAISKERIWYAETIRTGKPIKSKDYFIFASKGKKAPTPMDLMTYNAKKICKMIQWVSPDFEILSEDMKMVNIAKHYLKEKDIEKANVYFKEALKINPDNFAALYYMGVLHEEKGDKIQAMEMYHKIINK